MEENLNQAEKAAMPDAQGSGQEGFKTAMFGFHKAQVLAYVEKLTTEYRLTQAEQEAQVARLRAENKALLEERAHLEERAVGLEQQCGEQKTALDRAQAREAELDDQLQRARAQVNDFKQRLVGREQDYLAVKRGKLAAEEQLAELQKQLEEAARKGLAAEKALEEGRTAAAEQLAAVQREAERRAGEAAQRAVAVQEEARAALEKAGAELEEARRAAEQQRAEAQRETEKREETARMEATARAAREKEKMSAGAREIAAEAKDLRTALDEVDARISAALKDLEGSTAGIRTALAAAESQAAELAASMGSFPENKPRAKQKPAAAEKPPKPEPQPLFTARARAPRREAGSVRSTAASLLECLAELLEKKK